MFLNPEVRCREGFWVLIHRSRVDLLHPSLGVLASAYVTVLLVKCVWSESGLSLKVRPISSVLQSVRS